MKKLMLILATCSLFFSAASLSCQFHDYGENKVLTFPPMFPALHPVMLMHFSPPEGSPISVTLSRENATGSKQKLVIDYELDPSYHSVKAEIVGAKSIKFDGRTSKMITRKKGSHTVNYIASATASADIRVRFTAIRNNVPIIVEKRIRA